LNKVTIAFTGPPCAGKSTLAAEVARRLGLPHLSMDATRQRLLPDAAHTRADREVAYRAMEWAAEMLPDVVLDAPYGHDEDYAGLVRLRAVVIECRVSPETAVRRFRERGPDAVRKDLTEDVVRRMVEEYHYRGGALVIDTERVSAAESVDRVLSVLQPRRGDRD
jgi:adenylate kinase family enzyme